MADASIEFLIQNVKASIVFNAALLGDARVEVEALKSELELLKGAILDFSAETDPSYEHKALLNNVRKAVDMAEDTVDDFIIGKAKLIMRPLLRIVHPFEYLSSVRGIVMEITKIRQLVAEMNQRKAWTIPKRLSDSGDGFPKIPVVEEDDVVGFDEAAREIISYLLGDSEGLDVIGIVGMAGLGKTTLANKVYKDERIDYEFIHRAWAYVAQHCRVEDVFISILNKLGEEREYDHKTNSSELANEVRKCLRNKKYFIVLDGLWSAETWENLKVAFPNNNKCSRILLTTQHALVARRANLNRTPYYLKFLDGTESWELLEKRVFGKSKCPEDIRKFGELVARGCGGLPLAIVDISGTLLPNRHQKVWWERVARRVDAFVMKDESRLFNVVTQNYNSLPYNLQLCFLYCGLIPRGRIFVSKLIRLWISEGFIQDELTLGLENTARACLDNLVDMSLLIPVSRRYNGEIKACRIHDMLRDFCRQEADVQGIYHNIEPSNIGSFSIYRRICVGPSALMSVLGNSSAGKIRTILTFSDDIMKLEPSQTKGLKVFRKIRVLEASSIKFLRYPRELQELVLLRYLAFSCDFKSIPSSISNLWCLQTLIILTTVRVIEFPKEIWKLYQLRHLETNSSSLLPDPPKSITVIGQKNMQTLSTIAPESCTEKLFSGVPDVKKLGIRGNLAMILSSESKLIDNLGSLEQLRNLKLLNNPTSHSIQNLSMKFSRVVARLTKLTISGTYLDWKSMSILGDLEMLEVLKVKDNAFGGSEWYTNWGIFPSLRLLYIERTDLKYWEASNEQFPKLTSLFLRYCDSLKAIPTCLADRHSLQNLDVHNCCTSVVQSAKEIQMKRAISKLTIYPPEL